MSLRGFGAFVLFAMSGLAHAASLDGLFAEAERLRTVDPPRLTRALQALDDRRAEATPAQRDHLQLLHAYATLMRGDYSGAVATARGLADRSRDGELRYRANLLVANISAITGDYLSGLQYLERGLALDGQVRSPEIREIGHIVAATLYNEFDQPDLALRFSDETLAHARSPRAHCVAGQNRLQALQALGRGVDRSEAARVMARCSAIGERIAVALVELAQARQWAAEGRHDRALAQLDAALPLARKTGYLAAVALLQALRADQRLAAGDAAGAGEDARAVLAIPDEQVGSRARILAHQVLYRVAEQRHRPLEAFAHYRAYVEAERARALQLQRREAAYQLGRHELERSEATLQRLTGQNQTLRLREEVAQRRAWNLFLAAALLAVVTLSAALWGWRTRRTHHALRRLAQTDTLTGLGNRRHFRECAERLLADSRERGQPAALVLFDLDHFKQINDVCGHAAGDRVLTAVARAVSAALPEALHGRLGGEEFAFVLRNCDLDCAAGLAERCRQAIHAIDPAAERLAVSASLGVASTAQAGYDFEALVSLADAAMYAAKAAGRDRVVVAGAPA